MVVSVFFPYCVLCLQCDRFTNCQSIQQGIIWLKRKPPWPRSVNGNMPAEVNTAIVGLRSPLMAIPFILLATRAMKNVPTGTITGVCIPAIARYGLKFISVTKSERHRAVSGSIPLKFMRFPRKPRLVLLFRARLAILFLEAAANIFLPLFDLFQIGLH